MKNSKFILSVGLLVSVLLASCTKEEIMPFEAAPAVNFATKSVEYSFLGNPESAYVQDVEVKILGNATDYDRQVKVEVINDSLTTATPEQYEILGGVVEADAFTGKLRVKLLNSEQLNTEKVSLHLRITDSEDFSVGNRESVDFTVAWTNKVIVPSWSYYRYFFTAKASTAAYRAIVESTGATTFTINDYRALGAAGAQALGTKFGDYVKQWNLDHPNNHLKHDDGDLAGEEIVPIYYTHSKFD